MVETGVRGLQYVPRLWLWNGRKVSRERQKERQTGKADRPHLCQRETIDSRGHFATGNQSPKTSPKEQAYRNPPFPMSIQLLLIINSTVGPPHPHPSCPRYHSFRNLYHKYPFRTWLQYSNPASPTNALARIVNNMHSHTAYEHRVKLVPVVPPSCPEGQAEEKRKISSLLWCLLYNPTWHLYNLLQGYNLHPLQKSCN